MNPEFQGYQQKQDEDHLRLLTLFFRIYAGLCAFSGLISFVYIGFGTLLMANPQLGSSPRRVPSPPSGISPDFGPNFPPPPSGMQHHDSVPPQALGVMMILIGIVIFLVILALAIACLCNANWLRDRKNWVGAIVISAIVCLNMPLGTILGVCSLITLNRPSVKSLFDK